MNDALFQKLTKSLREEKAILAGPLQGRKTVLAREHPAAVRARLGKTQEEFAAMIGVPLGTLRNWEQGHRTSPAPRKHSSPSPRNTLRKSPTRSPTPHARWATPPATSRPPPDAKAAI
jgi:putative transcriptional regulator